MMDINEMPEEYMNDEPLLVTLKEMYDIYSSDDYKNYRDFFSPIEWKTMPSGKRIIPCLRVWHDRFFVPLIYSHIIAEQLLQLDCHDIEWSTINIYEAESYFALLELWLHPLVWVNPSELKNVVVCGRAAKEKFMQYRYDEVEQTDKYIYNRRIIQFADNPYVCGKDDLNYGKLKGTHSWLTITQDWETIRNRVMKGEHITSNDIASMKPYSSISLRNNLNIIAEARGGKRAAELLRMLQNEWENIIIWDSNIRHIKKNSPGEIEQFEHALKNGFKDLLAEWDADDIFKDKYSSNTRDSAEQKEYCEYIVKEAVENSGEYTLDEFESLFRAAAMGTGSDIAAFIKNNVKAGYLDMKGHQKKTIYNNLKKHFEGGLNYSYQNFVNAY